MKRVFLLLVAVVFSASVYAQEETTMDVNVDKEVAAVTEESADVNAQIADALSSDETLQKETVNYLKENPETSEALATIIEENEGSVSDIMTSVLGDSDLTTAAVNFIKENPEMLSKAMKLAGM